METTQTRNFLTFPGEPSTTAGEKSVGKLSELVLGFPLLNVMGTLDKEISSIAFDSRNARPGSLFVAVHGLKQNGARFIQDAIRQGTTAFITESPINQLNELSLQPHGPTAICVEDSRQALAWVSAMHYGRPSQNMNVVGVIGTNGKTTLTYILESIYLTRGVKPGVIGTINYRYGDFHAPASMTTPESPDLNRILRDMTEARIKDCLLEVSSHSIVLKRVWGLHFSLGVFTNLSRDHLDFHITMERYKNAKKELFQNYSMDKQVVNIDDPVGKEIVDETSRPTLTTGVDRPADVMAERCVFSESGSRFILKTPAGSRQIRTRLLGKHNIYNLLSGAAAAYSQGFSLDEIEKGLNAVNRIPGRFERIDNGQDFTVVVDYAHTHEALRNVLTAAATLTSKNIIVVFGCGGDRDRGKRKEMGRVALETSDFAVITSDNPRTEDPKRIIDDILSGVPSAAAENHDYITLVDRKQAIEYAVAKAQPGDLILIAGKGHEDYQILSSETIHFDDHEVAANAINQRMNRDRK